MDELWQEFCNGIASALGGLVVRALFTKQGLQVAGCVLAGGIVLTFCSNLSSPESQARSIVKTQCRNAWSFYYKNGRMSSTGINLGNNSTYTFGVVPTQYSNASIIAAQSIKSNFSNFVGIAFGFSYRNQRYSCLICKSNNYSNRNISPVLTSGALGCPNGYREVETIKP
ncbi:MULTISPECIES: hypothetical protein [unclassified Microcoleus]|uniref:hypothetical protein n=1 Tax=unclassified Microcoleus TaxID=2642155 RepID=UPI0025FD60ED|nr:MULTISPECIES: hypothetical protein [unclassified Microcoleus]